MAIKDVADSGLLGADDAGAGRKESGLDRAIAAAMGGDEFEDGDVPLTLAKDKQDQDRRKTKTVAGDDSAGEDAGTATRTRAKDGDAAATPEGDAGAIEAPKHWPEERRKAFAGWPAEVKAHALAVDKDLQAGFTRKSQELSDTARFGHAVRTLIDDETRQRMSATGLDEVGYFRYLDGLQKAAMKQPVQYVGWVMRQLGVSPEHLGLTAAGRQQQQVDPAQQYVDEQMQDPALIQLRTQIHQQNSVVQQLQARLEAQDRAARDWENQQQVNARNGLDGMWQTFRGQLDDTGQLAHPNADALMASMGALMETHRSLMSMPDGPEKLAKAYTMAEAADPELSKPRIEAEIAKRLADAEKKRETERARRATSVRPATGAPAVPNKGKGGIDGALEAAWDKLANRS